MRTLMLTLASLLLAPAAWADGAPDRYQESYALEAAYNYERALKQLDAVPLAGADAYLLPLRRGWLLYLLGRYDDSAAAYRRALAAQPDSLEAQLGATLPLMALRRWKEAEVACRAVLAAAPGDYTAKSRLAYILYSSGRYADSEVLYQELVIHYPADVEMRAGLGWAQLKQGDSAGARESLNYVLHLVPDHASAREGVAALK